MPAKPDARSAALEKFDQQALLAGLQGAWRDLKAAIGAGLQEVSVEESANLTAVAALLALELMQGIAALFDQVIEQSVKGLIDATFPGGSRSGGRSSTIGNDSHPEPATEAARR